MPDAPTNENMHRHERSGSFYKYQDYQNLLQGQEHDALEQLSNGNFMGGANLGLPRNSHASNFEFMEPPLALTKRQSNMAMPAQPMKAGEIVDV